LSCLTPALEWQGKAITTIEGLEANGELDAIQQAFIDYGAVQCGFCTPGVIMSAKAVGNASASPTEEQINDGMAGVLCRCTGHIKVKEAIRNVAGYSRRAATIDVIGSRHTIDGESDGK
jgi:carbon-monoxide dehydrogenase small subunit